VGTGLYVSEGGLVPIVPPVDTNPDPYFYNTSLLLHFDGSHNSTAITDTSYLPKTASVQGDAKISIAKNKFGGSSLRMDGNGDYISYAPHPGLDFNTEDFTIEFWAYCQDQNVNYPTYIANQGGWYEGSFGIRFDNTGSQRFGVYWNPGDPLLQSSSTFGFNQWRHVVVVRQGTTVRLYVDGIQEGTASIDASRTLDLCMGGSMRIGFSTWDGNNGYVNDYMDDLRITRGVCRYPDGASFTPPALPFSDIAPEITTPTAPSNVVVSGGDSIADISWTNSSSDKTIRTNYEIEYSEDVEPRSWTTVNDVNTKLLLHFNKGDVRGNASLVDSSMYGREILWNTNNNPAVIGGDSSGVFQKFGTGCLEIPYNRTGYTTPYIVKVNESSDLNPGTSDYTLEMFMLSEYYYSGPGRWANGVGRLFGSYNGVSGSYFALWSNGGWNGSTARIAKFVNGTDVYGINFTNYELNADTRNSGYYAQPLKHLVFCRQNGVMRIYLNGTKILETPDTNNDVFASGGLVIMGGESGSHNPNNYVLGRIDELRYVVGEALYTGQSIDLLPSAEFEKAQVRNIPNNKNYVFRTRAQNSAGYSQYSDESQSVLVAPPPELTITAGPQNNRVSAYNENATFSIEASDTASSPLTYQWQIYVMDAEYSSNKIWQNVDGATSTTLTINNQIFQPYCCYQPKMDAVRCLVTSPYTSKLSTPARLVSINNVLGNFGTSLDWNYYNSYIETNGIGYDLYYSEANQRILLSVGDYGGYYGGTTTDASWYDGNDARIKFQYSLDGSNWNNVDSTYDINFRSQDYNTYQNQLTPAIDLSGRVYFRTVIEDLWPYNTNNGTSSSSESVYSVILRYYAMDYTATAPTVPNNVTALGGNELVALSWTKGLSGGLQSSTTYTIEYSPDNSNWTTFTNTLPFNNSGTYVTGLTNGTQYYFRMKVVNSVGETSYTDVVSATPSLSAAVAPSAPANPLVVSGDGRVYLAWDVPSSDGRSPLTNYHIQYSTDNGVTWVDYSESPPALSSLTATSSGSDTIILSWSSGLVLPAITDYIVEYSSDNGASWTTVNDGTSTSTTATISGLSAGSYSFRVAGVNTVGQGNWATVVGNVGSGLQVEYLVVAGGGGGGRYYSGGGGAGGVLTSSNVSLNPGETYTVTVGGGGAALTGTSTGVGTSGSDSSFANSTASGGGYGAGSSTSATAGGAGGAGGGGTGSGGTGGTGISGQGNDGGLGSSTGGGGGGGAGAVGTNAGSGTGGSGGAGVSLSITGSSVTYAGGGGGSASTVGSGGAGGGGTGANDSVAGTSGLTNTGSGGGGGSSPQEGGSGGSGVVIIRAPQAASATTGSPTVTTDGSSTIYTFTGTGSITFGASSFAPSDISGLQLWLDASDNNTLYDATTGGSLVAADGAVKRWEDKSGNARHATEETNAPQRKVASINSLDALLFDGINDGLSFSGNIHNADGYVTVFAIVRKSSIGGVEMIINKDNSNVSPRAHQFLRVNESSVESIWHQSAVARTVSKGSISANTTFLATARIGVSGGAASLNGVAGTADTNVSGISTTNEPTHIGRYWTVNNANMWGGHICEIIAYNSALSDTDREAVENYLMTKWGIN
jgi:hypothetical protein